MFRIELERWEYVMAAVLIIGLVLIGAVRSGQMTGFIISDPRPLQVEVYIDYGGNSILYQTDISSQESALNALFKVATVDYATEGEEGARVTAINNVRGEWSYLVNGESPGVPPSHYFPLDGDVIIFRKS